MNCNVFLLLDRNCSPQVDLHLRSSVQHPTGQLGSTCKHVYLYPCVAAQRVCMLWLNRLMLHPLPCKLTTSTLQGCTVCFLSNEKLTVQTLNPMYESHTRLSMCPCRLSEQLNALGEEVAGVPGGQEGSSEDMSGLVDGIMHQLLAKDVLYQPIQEIGARYPQWLADHRCMHHLCFAIHQSHCSC